MVSLSALSVLAIWEKGRGQSPLERGLTMLSYALPDEEQEALADLRIGERDRLLLELRERSFGPQLKAFAACPRCQESLEYSLRTFDLAEPLVEMGGSDPGPREAAVGDFKLGIRSPSSADLAAVASAETVESARIRLCEGCVTEANRNGISIAVSELPEDIIFAVGEQVAAIDPGGEMMVRLTCPICHHEWPLVFDIASFMYAEISALARRILEDIHALASYYGWGEKEILALPAARREFYLKKVR